MTLDKRRQSEGLERRLRREVDSAFLVRLRACVDANLAEQAFGVTHLAAEMGLSRRQLARRCRYVTGMAPNQLIRTVRLEKGRDLLQRCAHATVAEVAYAVGFTPNYFSRIYVEAFGELPRDALYLRRNQSD